MMENSVSSVEIKYHRLNILPRMAESSGIDWY